MSDFAPEPNGAPAPEETPAEPVAEAPAEQTWVGPSQEEWQQSQQFMQAAGPILHQIATNMGMIQPQAPPQQQVPELDPFDPHSVQNYIDYQVNQRTENFSSLASLVEAQQGEQLARAELDRLHSEVGEFDDDTALIIASGLLDQGVMPDQALAQAAQQLRAYEEKVRANERERHGVLLQDIHEAPRETSANTGIGQEAPRVPTGKNRYEEAVNNFLTNRRPGLPIG